MKSQLTKYLRSCLLVLTLAYVGSLHAPSTGAQETPAAIHMIIVGDISESKMGVEVDLKRWCREFYEIKNHTGTTPSVVLFCDANDAIQDRSDSIEAITGSTVLKTDKSVDAVLKACDDLVINPNDTVIFYFGGHGFRTDEVVGKWPAILLHKNVDGWPKKTGVPLTRIFKKLSAKNPRLLLVMADCCNDWRPVPIAPPVALGWETPVPRDLSYKKLFLESKGHYLASGCLQNQKSRSDAKVGGYFTSQFFDSLEVNAVDATSTGTSSSSWDSIFTSVSKVKLWKSPENAADYQQSQWELVPAGSTPR